MRVFFFGDHVFVWNETCWIKSTARSISSPRCLSLSLSLSLSFLLDLLSPGTMMMSTPPVGAPTHLAWEQTTSLAAGSSIRALIQTGTDEPGAGATTSNRRMWAACRDGTLLVVSAQERQPLNDGTVATPALSVPTVVLGYSADAASKQKNTYPMCLVYVAATDEVWVGYSDGPVLVFLAAPPYTNTAVVGFPSSIATVNDMHSHGHIVAAACNDEVVLCFDARQKALLGAPSYGHHGAVTKVLTIPFVVLAPPPQSGSGDHHHRHDDEARGGGGDGGGGGDSHWRHAGGHMDVAVVSVACQGSLKVTSSRGIVLASSEDAEGGAALIPSSKDRAKQQHLTRKAAPRRRGGDGDDAVHAASHHPPVTGLCSTLLPSRSTKAAVHEGTSTHALWLGSAEKVTVWAVSLTASPREARSISPPRPQRSVEGSTPRGGSGVRAPNGSICTEAAPQPSATPPPEPQPPLFRYAAHFDGKLRTFHLPFQPHPAAAARTFHPSAALVPYGPTLSSSSSSTVSTVTLIALGNDEVVASLSDSLTLRRWCAQSLKPLSPFAVAPSSSSSLIPGSVRHHGAEQVYRTARAPPATIGHTLLFAPDSGIATVAELLVEDRLLDPDRYAQLCQVAAEHAQAQALMLGDLYQNLHRELHLRNHPPVDHELEAAVADTQRCVACTQHMRRVATTAAEASQPNTLALRYLRKWSAEVTFRRTAFFVRVSQSLELLRLNSLGLLSRCMSRWTFVSAAQRHRRCVREVPALSLRKRVLWSLQRDRFRGWATFARQRWTAKRLDQLVRATKRHRISGILSRWERGARIAGNRRRLNTVVRRLISTSENRHRGDTFGRWKARSAARRVANRLQARQVACLEVVATQTDRGKRRHAYTTWVAWRSWLRSRRAKQRTIGFLQSVSTKFFTHRYFLRWLQLKRLHQCRLALAPALMRLSGATLQRIYYSRWRSFAVLRRRSYGSANGDEDESDAARARSSILDFFASKNDVARRRRAYLVWFRWQKRRSFMQRKEKALSAVLRQTTFGVTLTCFRKWSQWREQSAHRKQRRRCAELMCVGGPPRFVLQRRMDTWRRFAIYSHQRRQRLKLLSTLGSATASTLRVSYFRRWFAAHNVLVAIKGFLCEERRKAISVNSARSLLMGYTAKWLSWLQGQRRRQVTAAVDLQKEKQHRLDSALIAADATKSELTAKTHDAAASIEQCAHAQRQLSLLRSRRADVDKDLDNENALSESLRRKLLLVQARLRRYAATLQSKFSIDPMAVAQSWHARWQLLDKAMSEVAETTEAETVTTSAMREALTQILRFAEETRQLVLHSRDVHLSIQEPDELTRMPRRAASAPRASSQEPGLAVSSSVGAVSHGGGLLFSRHTSVARDAAKTVQTRPALLSRNATGVSGGLLIPQARSGPAPVPTPRVATARRPSPPPRGPQ